ncbi:hypothetical protein H4Q26_003133 [Puccinia striiformis f. sp. tritici PST-130]|nr:hypothetical protein H4Q26_003133 [Puccinia striiformis f. sp. tritici PST-130]
MADNIEQAPATAELSAQEQISALRGDFVDLKTSLSDFLSQMKATQHPPPPPGRELPPHQQTQQPPPPVNTYGFHDQFSRPSNHHPADQPAPATAPPPSQPGNPQGFPVFDHADPAAAQPFRFVEPTKLAEVWFTGETSELIDFLKNIRTFLSPREMYFASYKRMIIWVSLHFGFPPSERRRESSRSQNWFKSLIQQNAWDQNVTNPYADLERLPFILPALSSWDAFEDCLIESFADKFIAQSAKAALEACVQGSTSVDDYNSRFSSLVYLVNMGEHLRIDRYVKGLHIDIVSRVESPIWRAVPTLARKMRMASEAARDLEIIASLSAPNQSGKVIHRDVPLYQHPNANHRASDAMEIDAATYSHFRPPTPFEALFKRVCLAQRRFWLGQLLLPDR